MRTAFALCLSLFLASAVMAEDDVEVRRQSIAAARAQAQEEFIAQEAACAKRFAVTPCMEEVAARRRASNKKLARQEAELNKAERLQRVTEQRQRLEDKARERVTRDAQTPAGEEVSEEKLQQQRDKQAQHRAQAASAAGQPPAASQPSLTASAQKANRQAFEQKQKAAQERKAARDKRLHEGTQPRQPLPTPP